MVDNDETLLASNPEDTFLARVRRNFRTSFSLFIIFSCNTTFINSLKLVRIGAFEFPIDSNSDFTGSNFIFFVASYP